jgi:hypothetical protein
LTLAKKLTKLFNLLIQPGAASIQSAGGPLKNENLILKKSRLVNRLLLFCPQESAMIIMNLWVNFFTGSYPSACDR